MTTETKNPTKTKATTKPAKKFPPHPLLPPMPAKAAKPGESATILALVQRKIGATVEELQRATGWQEHSVRGFLSTPAKRASPRSSAPNAKTASAYTPRRIIMAITHQQITWAINDAAIRAAESAFDAFGDDPAAEIPSPEVAWEFLNEQVYEDGEIERPVGLPQVLTRQFKQDYSRHIRRMVAQREGRTV